jgi:AcrR family transcriptional regulator
MAQDAVWLRPATSGIGRPARHTREAITLAAIDVAGRDGLASLTMRRVASELGTSAGSLYRHVTSREELIDLMVDHVGGEYILAQSSDRWIDDLVALALQGLEINRRHPWLGDVRPTPLVGPNGLNLSEHVLALLEGHPATDSQKLIAFAVMNALITAFARSQPATPDPDRVQSQAAYLAHVLPQGRHPHLAALVPDGPEPSDEIFPDVIRGVLRGLLEPSPSPGGATKRTRPGAS